MIPRERLLKAMSREVPDKVPRDISWGMSPIAFEKFKEKTGSSDFMDYFKVEYRFLDFLPTAKKNNYSKYFENIEIENRDLSYNEWGIGSHKGKDSDLHFTHIVSPLTKANDLNEIIDFPMPDLMEDYRHKHFEEEAKQIHGKGLAIAAPMYQTLFETAWQIRGIDEFFIDMIEHPEFVDCLLDKIMEIRIKSAELYASMDVDVMMLGDDVSMQTGMFFDPRLWRKLFKSRMAEIIQRARSIKPKLHVFYHSDGDPTEIIDDLIEIGVNILNPVQPECIDPAEVKAKYGDKLAFWGTIGVQSTLPFGTPKDVRNEVKTRMETVGKRGGFVIGPTHMIEPEVPWENIVALYDAIEEYGYYT